MASQHKHTILHEYIFKQSVIRVCYVGLIRSFLILFFFFLLFTLNIASSFAQHTYILDKTTRFDKMGARDGLSSEYTTCIHQDKYGFIWIGTQFGLNLYDGYEIKVFNSDPKNPQSINNNSLTSIFEEIDGTMWFGTQIGISKYNRSNQTFSNFIPDTVDIHNLSNSVQKILPDGDFLWVDVPNDLFRFNKKTGEFTSFAKDTKNPSKGIYSSLSSYMFIDRQGVLWVSSSEVGDDFELNRFNKDTETFTHFINNSTNPESFIGKEVMSMTEDKNGTIWLATLGGGLLKMIDKEKGKFRQYLHDDSDPNSIISNNLHTVFEDSRSNIWIGGSDGFSLIDKKTNQFTNYQIPKRTYNSRWVNIITDINESKNGELWLTSWDGLFWFNPSTNNLLHFLNDDDNQNSVSESLIHQSMYDSGGLTWIVTMNSGICRINPYSNYFKIVQKKPNVKNSLSGNSIYRFLVDSKDNLWVGGFDGLNKTKFNKQKIYDNFKHYSFDPDDPKTISSKSINVIYEDKDKILWFGTWAGLNKYDSLNDNFTHFQHKPGDYTSISDNTIEAIFEDSYGVFWIGTRYGLNIMDRQSGKFTQFVPNKIKLAAKVGADTRVIFEDSYGELWFGGDFLTKLNRKDTSFIPYFSDSVGLHDINLTDVWSIAEDDSSNLWISTIRDGVYKYNRGYSSLTAITIDQGLPSNTIEAIETDDRNFIWVSTTQGISRIDPNNLSIKTYDVDDGLVSQEFLDRSSYKDKDGWLYFGSLHGFNIFHPDSIKDNTYIPPVYITSLKVGGQQKYFDQPLFETTSIELKYNENDFSFDFVALNYINSQKNQFAYMLEGYDENWNYVGNRRTAYYTNLSPGEYTFRVKASNNDGYWNEEGASLTLVIHPPFWATWWAYLLYFSIFIGLLYLLRHYELNRLHHKQNWELEQVHREKLTEIDIEKNKFFSNVSHEFRTPITLILGPLERIIKTQKNINLKQELMLVRRNARRLQTLINQLLSLSKLESGKMQLKARPENIVKLASLFLHSFSSMAEDKQIKLEFESDAEEHVIYIDTLKIEKVANNLLSNAFKFTEKGGKIKVSVDSIKSSLNGKQLPVGIQIRISDTGIGIRKEKIPHVFDRFYQVDEVQMKTYFGTGIGLSLTKELVELHHGTITADSEPGMGTTFTIFLPSGKDHLAEEEIFKPGSNGLNSEDELFEGDYLFIQDVAAKSGSYEELPVNDKLPTILIVEDNEDMRAYIKSYLIDSYNIVEASNGKEGAEKAIELGPDLIVSDLMMPFVDGNEMTIQLKSDERTSHIPIILLTAKASMESKLEGLETGADDFLTKPFNADELKIRIKNLIDQRIRLRKLLYTHLGDTDQTRLIHDSFRGMSKIDERFLEKAKKIVYENMADPDFSVEMFAEHMAMSRVQLHRKLKSLTNHSASDLVRDLRLLKAAELLKEGDLNVTQVSYEVGISSLSYFAKTFKDKYGVTPSEFH